MSMILPPRSLPEHADWPSNLAKFQVHTSGTDVVAIDRFGAAAPGGTVFRELGVTPENVAARARDLLGIGVGS